MPCLLGLLSFTVNMVTTLYPHTISMQCSRTFLKVDYFLISNVHKVNLDVITSIETSGMPPLKNYCFAKGKLAAHM